jgi:hypothetical protein
MCTSLPFCITLAASWNLRNRSPHGDHLVPAVSQLAERLGLDAGRDIRVEVTGTPAGDRGYGWRVTAVVRGDAQFYFAPIPQARCALGHSRGGTPASCGLDIQSCGM